MGALTPETRKVVLQWINICILLHLLDFYSHSVVVFTGLLTACSQAVSKPVWHIPLLFVQWKTPDDGQRNCPKQVEFYSKNKFEKLVHLVGFIIRVYHDARSPGRQKKNQLDAQLIFSIFHQPLHVSGVSRPIMRYNRMCTTIGTYYSF